MGEVVLGFRIAQRVDTKILAQNIQEGQRRALARGLTLVESLQPQHEKLSLQIFHHLGHGQRAFRLGVTGPPGAGKSTMIERIVSAWVNDGHRVAVLAIDPSSRKTGGSLLGDKTRMGAIADHPNVFVRPSPTAMHLGGLNQKTPLMCALLERAGFSHIVVETVGVGQSEIAASFLVDRLLLIALPGAGDEVQGIKRGLMEEVDVIAVNKSDLGNARSTLASLRAALRVFRRDVPVIGCSAIEGQGLDELMNALNSPVVESEERRIEGETYFFDQYLLQSLRKMLESSDFSLAQMRSQLESGDEDFLSVLPSLTESLAKWRDSLRGI